MHQHVWILGMVRDDPPVCRPRLPESSILKRQIAQQLERIVAPGAAEHLIDHPPQQRQVAPALPLGKPALCCPVHPSAINRSRLRRQLRDRPVAIPAIVHIKHELARIGRSRSRTGQSPPLRRQHGHPLAELLDHFLIHLHRFRPVRAPRMVRCDLQVLRRRTARVRVKRRRPAIVPLTKLPELAQRQTRQTAGKEKDKDRQTGKDAKPHRNAHPARVATRPEQARLVLAPAPAFRGEFNQVARKRARTPRSVQKCQAVWAPFLESRQTTCRRSARRVPLAFVSMPASK